MYANAIESFRRAKRHTLFTKSHANKDISCNPIHAIDSQKSDGIVITASGAIIVHESNEQFRQQKGRGSAEQAEKKHTHWLTHGKRLVNLCYFICQANRFCQHICCFFSSLQIHALIFFNDMLFSIQKTTIKYMKQQTHLADKKGSAKYCSRTNRWIHCANTPKDHVFYLMENICISSCKCDTKRVSFLGNVCSENKFNILYALDAMLQIRVNKNKLLCGFFFVVIGFLLTPPKHWL